METQKNKKAKPKILYVDDELASLTGFKSIFRNHYDVYTAKSANEGYDIMKKENISLVISDQRMPGETGVEFLQKIRVDFPDAVRMIVTGYSDIDAVIKAINKSMVYYYFSKPFEADDMKMIMDNAIERLELRRQNKELLDRLSVMVDKLKQHKAKLEKEVKQRQLAEEEVRKLNKDLLVLDKAKADFLRIISHEIRTPLNGIIGPFQLLKDGILSADFKDILTILDASVKRLEKFALTALKITDLQTRSYQLYLSEVEISAMLDEVLNIWENTIRKKNIRVKKVITPENLCFKADRELVELCLGSIIENAVKFSPEKSTISVTIAELQDEVIFQIMDQGEGFSDFTLQNYHKLFSIGEEHIDGKIGLDLTLAKMIVDAHNGKMLLSNRKEGGGYVRIQCSKNKTE